MTSPATPDAIRAARARLVAAREALGDRPREKTLAALAALLDGWADPAGAARARLVAELPAATGFDAATILAGLDCALPRFAGDALREIARSEERAAPGARFEGFAQTSVLLAGSIPMPTVASLLFPLLLHSPVLAKTASRDPVTARVFAASLAEIDPELARCLEVVSFPGDDAACTDALCAADCVVATGSDETVEAVARRVPAAARFVAYGHRLSVAVVGPDATSGPALADVAGRLARDVALWDQQGCLSPVCVYCESDGARARALGEALGDALEDAEARWPRGRVEPDAAAAIRAARDEALVRRADGRDVAVIAPDSGAFTVVVEDDVRFRAAPLHRFVRVHPARSRAALVAAVGSLGRHLAAVAVDGFGAASDDLARAFARAGASRVCAAGALQAPPLGWHRDGLLLVAPLARLSDFELPR